MFAFIKASMRNMTRRVVMSAVAGVTTLLRGEHYDIVRGSDATNKHFRGVKENTPRNTNTPYVRANIRSKCRYEADNNCYLSGLVSTLATDTIGYVAPKLQTLTDNPELNTFIETEWIKWSENSSVNLSSKLRVLDETRRIEGEGFLMMIQDAELESQTGMGLNIVTISPARVCDSGFNYDSGNHTVDIIKDGVKVGTRSLINDDGVIVDGLTGRPVEYKVTKLVYDYNFFATENQQTVSARYMLQWFCPRRPGQFRGVCELAPALPLYAQLRRYGLATLTSAEIAAMFSAIMTTQVPPGTDPPSLELGLKIPLEPGMLMSGPEGADIHQMRPEQPITGYEMFVNLILREIGRTLDVPFGIVAGDSSKYNYSSAQLDYRGYEERMGFDKKQLNLRILNPVHEEFLLELSTMPGRLNQALRKVLDSGKMYYTWHYSRRPSSNPTADATADDMKLRNGTTTLAEIYAAKGMDWEEQMDQRQKENSILSQKKLVFSGINDTMYVESGTTDSGTSGNNLPNKEPVTSDNPVASADTKDAAKSADLQQTALNGAQITSIVLIGDKVASGEYTADAGLYFLKIAFPLADVELLKQFVDALSKSKGATKETPNVPANAA